MWIDDLKKLTNNTNITLNHALLNNENKLCINNFYPNSDKFIFMFNIKNFPSCCGILIFHNFLCSPNSNLEKKIIKIAIKNMIIEYNKRHKIPLALIALNQNQDYLKELFIECGFKILQNFNNHYDRGRRKINLLGYLQFQ